MLKYIFKSATGSFSRTIGRILAYIAIGASILFLGSFLNIANVKAISIVDSFFAVNGTKISDTSTVIRVPGNVTFSFGSYVFFDDATYGSDVVYEFDFVSTGALPDNLSDYNNTCRYEVSSNGDTASVGSYTGTVYHLKVYTYVDKWSGDYKGPGSSCSVSLKNYSWSSFYRLYSKPTVKYYTKQNQTQDIIDGVNQNIDDLKDKQDETNNKLDDVNNNITNDKVDGAQGSANDFFNNFENKDYGLSDIITMPLSFINNITNSTCTPLTIPLPFVNTNLTLPCMKTIYSTYFGDILNIYQTITFGIVAYWVCINIFRMVKNFKDPDNDEIEVLDL